MKIKYFVYPLLTALYLAIFGMSLYVFKLVMG